MQHVVIARLPDQRLDAAVSSFRRWLRDGAITIAGFGFMFAAIASLQYQEQVSPAVSRLANATADMTRGVQSTLRLFL